jgi:putative membrane-bound dehydrogenase-like protein
MTSSRTSRAAAALLPLLLVLLADTNASTADTNTGPRTVRPVGRDGHVLNLDFETGTLSDWTASGNAFDKQPVRGDLVSKRRGDMKSNHQGEFWIGGFEVLGDDGVGTLTSAPFKVTHRWASFLVAGGRWQETRVELCRAEDDLTFYTFNAGNEDETLHPVVVDMERHIGREFYIKLIDERKGHWGHLNFDNFVFYEGDQRPQLADEIDLKKLAPPPPVDVVKFAGLKPQEAVAAMTMPPGFKATVFASEPDVVQPIAMAIDARGRIWVAQGMTYPIRQPEGQGKDSILIFEDTNGDGVADKRTVFAEGLNLVSGFELGFGGVWVGAAPYLLFIPDKNRDDKPDGPPQILLDGFAYQDTHETLNTFTWGPDGWLYGCHGVFTYSAVGKPGASTSERTKINAGIWRYHPTQHKFEIFAEGTSNPWGMDFDEHGQLWAEACVIPHLWHIIQGGRYQRQAGQHFNPYVFDDIKQSADHVHYAGSQGPHAGNGRSDAAGGGHAHAGLMVYQGNNWPAEYRGKIFIGNIHGQRINMDVPEPKGSGFVGHHGADFLNFNDRASQVVNFREGPDGAVYFIDWYDLNQCHSADPNVHDRSNGRIYRVAYGNAKLNRENLASLHFGELIDAAANGDGQRSRTALRLLYESPRERQLSRETLDALDRTINGAPQGPQRLRALWTLNAISGMPDHRGLALLKNVAPHVVGWTVQLLAERGEVSGRVLEQFNALARESQSPVVRLYIASALQRLRPEQRWDALAGLLSHSDDADDHNLPLMDWYAFEPMATVDPQRMLAMALEAKIPNILTFTVRRIAAMEGEAPLAALVGNLSRVQDPEKQLAILRGVNQALRGRRSVAMPKGWEAVEAKLSGSDNEAIRSQVRGLAVTFGSKAALASLRQTLADPKANVNERHAALDSLLNVRASGLAPVLQQLLTDERMRSSALRGLAAYDDPKTPEAILRNYDAFSPPEKKDALATLSSRAEFAKALLAAVQGEHGAITAKDISADIVRQLRNLQNAEIDKAVEKVWGVVRASPEDKLKRINALKAIVASTRLAPADPSHGRFLFVKTCAQCHTLFGSGGQLAPDITGANRSDLNYVLENVVDPNALVPVDYQAWILDTKDGRTIVGVLKKQEDKAVTIVTNTETITVPRNEIDQLRISKLSMMPEGLLDTFPENDIRDLIAYVRSPSQVPLAASAESAKDFFNGKDLTGWDGDKEVWSVSNGEIVGKTAKGLKQNNFLKSQMEVSDFRLVLKIKLVPNEANSGVQFRSEPFEGYEMKGPQADAGAGWWGKLYEENGRGLLVDKNFEQWVNKNDWNTYEIVAVGSKVRTALNGHVCVDIDDPKISRKGVIAVQVHAGGPTEVRFKDLELEVNPEFKLKTAR